MAFKTMYCLISLVSLAIVFLLSSCTAQFQQGDVVLNFCDIDTDYYIDCTEIGLTTDAIAMSLEALSSDVETIDSIVFELPEEGVYCSTDNDDIISTDGENYDITVSCDLTDYENQNTQLSFTVTMTLSDGTTVTETGVAEDWV